MTVHKTFSSFRVCMYIRYNTAAHVVDSIHKGIDRINGLYMVLKNSLIIHEENTKKNHKRVVSVYVIQVHVDLHKL